MVEVRAGNVYQACRPDSGKPQRREDHDDLINKDEAHENF